MFGRTRPGLPPRAFPPRALPPRAFPPRALPRRASRGESGFTFIELMAVITIVGLLSAIVFSNMEGMTTRGSLSAAARSFGNEILYVRDLAGLHGREIFIEVDLRKQRWRIIDPPSALDVPDEQDREEYTYYADWYELEEEIVLEELAFGRNERESGGTVTLAFDANGELSPSGFVAYFRHEELDQDDGISVEVTGLTGLVAFHKGRIESEEIRDPGDF